MADEKFVWNDQTSPELLYDALKSRNHGITGTLLDSLCADLDKTGRRIDATIAKNILAGLRKYAQFDRLKQMAEKFNRYAQNDRKVLLQLAQARIELGDITTAIGGLLAVKGQIDSTLQTPNLSPTDREGLEYDLGETIGLLGRCYKQYYINAKPSQVEPRYHDLDRSLAYYSDAYDRGLGDYLWHGINRVALLNHRERIATQRFNSISPKAETVAKNILKAIDDKEYNKLLGPWDHANRIEANLAIGNTPAAIDATKAYLDDPDIDIFSVQSTRRQLIEVWMLDENQPPGSEILPLMAARSAELGGGSEVMHLDPAQASNYEKVWSATKYKSLGWLLKAIERAKSVARIGPTKYDGDGTGFLFDGGKINNSWKGKPLLLTNAHVCSNDPEVQQQYPYPSPPEELTAAFLGTGSASAAAELKFSKLVWTSKPSDLDATLLELENAPEDWKPLPVTTRTPPVTLKGDARLNILGHPKGMDLRISLQDNMVTDVGDKYVHYKTPTDPGSSGSPVFNQKWDVVALHHSASTMRQANEGVRIDVIIKKIKSALT